MSAAAGDGAGNGPLPRTNWPHDAPDAAELIEAVRDYLHHDLGPRATGRDRWMVRIAANALTIAARELEHGTRDAAAHAARLATFGVDTDEALGAAIRAGHLDDRRTELARSLWTTTLDKLAVANPGYRDPAAEPPTIADGHPAT